jgi:hypothetical protein
MKVALYILEANGGKTSFRTEPLSVKKCLQVKRISEAGKRWKGYSLKEMIFNMNGLVKLHIEQHNQTRALQDG